MTTSHNSDTQTDGFVCEGRRWFCSGCAGESFYGEQRGKRYCVLHLPSKDKSADFNRALEQKIEKKDFDFGGVWFPDYTHFNIKFTGDANFLNATFDATADFRGATFEAAANFFSATFNGDAYFRVRFSNYGADFSYATFNAAVYFEQIDLKIDTDFHRATFKDRVQFIADDLRFVLRKTLTLDLQFVRIENAEHFSFHTLTLRPSCFVNVDAHQFEFTNVDWQWQSIDEEIHYLRQKGVGSPHRMLSIACRHLSVNAEEDHRYEEASKFRYMAMDTRRLEHWRGFDFRRLSWWYWLASGYGERVLRAGVVLLGILLVSALLYTKVGFARWEPRLASGSDAVTANRDETGAPLKLSRALTYSAAVMTFQRPEPKPATTAAQTIVLLETILGPVQAALLALAIRRKFMR